MNTMQRALAAVLAGLLLATMPWAPGEAARAQAPGWRDSGIARPDLNLSLACFDTSQPNVVVANETDSTVAYNWATGQRTVLRSQPSYLCGPNGLVYAGDTAKDQAVRFSAADPHPHALAHSPTHVAEDGTLQVYALTPVTPGPPPRPVPKLWASADGGLTWQQRGRQLRRWIETIALAGADARAIYALVSDRDAQRPMTTLRYTIYFSPDAGITWEPRSSGQAEGVPEFGGPYLGLVSVPGRASPVGTVELGISRGNPGSSARSEYYLSSDGARTFRSSGAWAIAENTQLVFTRQGVLRMNSTGYTYSLTRSYDGGQSWEPVASPSASMSFGAYQALEIARDAPANVFLRDSNGLWFSPDNGQSWQQFEDRTEQSIAISPYLPLTVLGTKNHVLWSLDLPDASKHMVGAAVASDAPGNSYFAATGHNLSGLFKRYWERNGGLAQFGYPKTEPSRELNPTDGKVYLAQYFERNRFEYHPELAGTPYDVLLGLLGNQLTETRRAAGEAPFNRVTDPQVSGVRYFPQTGHTLSGAFQGYWAANGGLEIYGYPISEAFEEVNPDDGKTYVVQYFERNRFEEHPELAGTRYEVLLGLLGNTLLRQKGWE